MGNTCRSPAAEGLFRKFVTDTGRESGFHIGAGGFEEVLDILEDACASFLRRL